MNHRVCRDGIRRSLDILQKLRKDGKGGVASIFGVIASQMAEVVGHGEGSDGVGGRHDWKCSLVLGML